MIDWISTKDRLLQGNNIEVLTTEQIFNKRIVKIRRYFSDNYGYMMDSYEWYGAGFYDHGYESWFRVDTDDNVVAWAYLPEPYEGE